MNFFLPNLAWIGWFITNNSIKLLKIIKIFYFTILVIWKTKFFFVLLTLPVENFSKDPNTVKIGVINICHVELA